MLHMKYGSLEHHGDWLCTACHRCKSDSTTHLELRLCRCFPCNQTNGSIIKSCSQLHALLLYILLCLTYKLDVWRSERF